MPDTFNCPNCGAPLDYQGSDPMIRCPYCNTSVVVPDNLRAKPSFSSQPSNFTLTGAGNLGSLLQQAKRFKEVKDLAQAGNIDEAVRVYCEITGVSPEMARASVEALSLGRPIVLSSMNASNVSTQISQAMGESFNTPTFSTPVAQVSAPAPRSNRRMGCIMSCAITAFVLVILAATLIPIVAAFGGNTLVSNLLGGSSNSNGPGGISLPALGFANQELGFGSQGSGPGLFNDVRGLGINPATGAIFAADYEGGRVQSFDPTGKFVTQWTLNSDSKDKIITGMASDRNGNVFIAADGKIYRYDATGNLAATLVVPDTYINNLVVGADGNIVAAADNETILRMTTDGTVLNTFQNVFTDNGGDDELDMIVAVDGTNNIYILGTFNNAVFKLSPDGKFITRFGSDGDGQGQFRAPESIGVDGFGRVYIGDFKGIQVFDSTGRYLNLIQTDGVPRSLTFDDQNKLYFSSSTNKVFRFNVQKPSDN